MGKDTPNAENIELPTLNPADSKMRKKNFCFILAFQITKIDSK